MAKVDNYIFVDEAGDPGPPSMIDPVSHTTTPTGASPFYIVTALCVTAQKMFKLEDRILEIKHAFKYKKEIKSNDISLSLYEALLNLLNELEIKTYYRLIDKSVYPGVFKVDGQPALHNVFDEFNVVRAVAFAIADQNLENVEVVIDRTDRRLLDGKFDSFDSYLRKKVAKCIGDAAVNQVSHITHVNSEYVNAMQMSDLVSGAIRESFTQRNITLKQIIDPTRLINATGKYERKPKKRTILGSI